jgi:hypothetical protein
MHFTLNVISLQYYICTISHSIPTVSLHEWNIQQQELYLKISNPFLPHDWKFTESIENFAVSINWQIVQSTTHDFLIGEASNLSVRNSSPYTELNAKQLGSGACSKLD